MSSAKPFDGSVCRLRGNLIRDEVRPFILKENAARLRGSSRRVRVSFAAVPISTGAAVDIWPFHENEDQFYSTRDAKLVINPEKVVANSVLGDAELQCDSLIQ